MTFLFGHIVPGLFNGSGLSAQPANNTCSGYIIVPLDGTCTSGTTVNATDNWTGTVGCQAGNNPEVWYGFTADSTNISIQITAGTMTGDLEFILVAAPSFNCANLTLAGSSCGPSVLTDTITGLTVGEDYIFSVSSSTGGDGTFDVCITSLEFPPVSAGDCVDAVTVCTSLNFLIQPDGYGSVMEIPPLGTVGNPDNANPGGSGNAGCLRASPPERNSTWMIINIDGAGMLEFTFGGNGTQSGYYDWIMYPWNPNVCTDIPTGNYAPVRCNWNACIGGGTGLAATLPGDACTFIGSNNFEPPLAVACGEKYIICFSNWSSVVTNVPLEFFGTAAVTCTPFELPISVIPPDPVICPGESVALTASGADTYVWSPDSGLSDTTGTVVIASPTVTTTYTVTGTAGCYSGDTTITVVVNSLNAGFTFSGSQCLGTNNISFTNTGAAPNSCGAGCPTYTWDFGDGTNSSGTGSADANPSHVYGSGDVYTVTQIIDDSGCTSTFSLDVLISDPLSTIIGTEESCNSGCDGAIDLTVLGGLAPYAYTWNTGPTSEDIIDVCEGFYSVTTVDALGCSVTDTVTLNPIVDVVAGFTASPDQCLEGNSFSFTNTGDPPGSCGGNCPLYWWDFGDGATSTGTDISAANPSHVYSAFGIYTVTQVLTDGSGCTDTATTVVEVFEAPTASAVSTDEACFNACDGTITLTTSGGASIAIYAWSNGASTQNLTGLCGGTYSVTVTDVNGCTDSTSITVNTGVDIKAGFTYSSDQCFTGNGFDFTNTGSVPGVCGAGCPTFTWDFGDSSTQTGTTAGDASPSHTYGAPGVYTVSQIVSDGGCADTVIQTITVFEEPTTSIVPTSGSCDSICDGLADLTVTLGTMTYTYNWSNFETSQDLNGVCTGTYTVTVTDANGCTAIDSVTITQGVGITATSTTVDVSCIGMSDGTATATGSTGTAPYTYTWSNGDNSATADSLAAGTFYVTVTDSVGCSTIDTVVIIEPPTGLSSTVATTDVSCNGGSDGTATVSPTGGTSPYTYSWTNGDNSAGADSLAAGTVYVTITDSNGCTAADSAIITELPALTNVLVSTNANCNGASDGTATVTPSGGSTPYTYAWSNGDISALADSLSQGSYTVTITDSNSCIDSGSVIITEPTALSLVAGSIDASCGASDGKAFVTVSGGTGAYTYSWNDPGTQTTDTAFAVNAGAYVVTITDSAGCVDSVTATVSNFGAPTVTITASIDVSCNGGNDGSATVTPVGGITPYAYLWDDSSNQTDSTAVGLPAGNYVATVTDSAGCIATVVHIVTEPPALILTESFTDANCGQNDGSATLTVNGGTGAYTYLWNDTGNQTNATANGLLAGTYQVLVTDSNSCMDSVSVVIADIPGGVASISSFNNVSCNGICDGDATALVTGGTSPYNYSWNDPGAQTTVQATGLCFGLVDVITTDSNGCADTASILIVEPPVLIATTDTTDASCNGVCDGVLQAIASGGMGGFAYIWSNTTTNSTASALCAGSYAVTVTDLNTCTVITGGTITEPPALVLVMDSVDAVCNAANGKASVSVSGGYAPYSYLWNDGAAQTTDTAINLLPGTYLATITDSAGCVDTSSVVVIAAGVPTAAIDIASVLNVSCNGLSDGKAGVAGSNGVLPYTYLWDDPGASSTDTAFNLGAGFYTVTITDADGCFDTDTITITEPPAMVAPITITNVSCFGDADGNLCVTVSGGTTPYTYSWFDGSTNNCSNGSGPIVGGCVNITDASGCPLQVCDDITEPAQLTVVPDTTHPNCFGGCDGSATVIPSGGTPVYTYSWDDPAGQAGFTAAGLCDGQYNVTVTDVNGCTFIETFQVIEPLAMIDAIIGTPATCIGQCDGTSTLNTTTASPPYTYNWQNGQSTSTATGLCVGTTTVTVMGASGCTENTSYTVLQSPSVPLADFEAAPNPTTLFDPAVSFTNLSLPDPNNLNSIWDFGDNSNSTLTDPIHVYEDTGTFYVQLLVYDINGCLDSITKIVIIEGTYILFVPSSFSPNDDGFNDYFIPKGIGIDNKDFQMYIFNRWGDQIYYTDNVNEPWNGRANNGSDKAQEDVYVWLIKTRDTGENVPHQYVGHVTLIR